MKPYDIAAKDLIETDPAGWVTFLGSPAPPDSVRLVDADLSSVSAEADKVIRVNATEPWLLHLELQASRDASLARRMLRYNAMLHERHELPVASVAVLLRPAANDPRLTGELSIRPAIGRESVFRYEVVKIWELDPVVLVAGPLGLVPLAPLGRTREPELPGLIEAMKARIDLQTEASLRGKLWVAAYLLMGLRYDDNLIETLLAGVRQMEESTTYQSLMRRGLQQGLQQGSALEARKLLFRAGNRLGTVPPAVSAAINAIDDTARLESLFDRVLTVASWDELLTTP
ncbi:MAG: hypothetical protein U0791_14045 [Gemmataceae bacterium]